MKTDVKRGFEEVKTEVLKERSDVSGEANKRDALALSVREVVVEKPLAEAQRFLVRRVGEERTRKRDRNDRTEEVGASTAKRDGVETDRSRSEEESKMFRRSERPEEWRSEKRSKSDDGEV